MKTTPIPTRWPNTAPPDIEPLRRQFHYLLWEYRWFRLRRLLGRFARLATQGIASLLAVTGLCLLLLHGGTLLRRIDPTAAVIDIGALSLVLLAVVTMAIFLAVSRWLVGLLWPVLRDYQRFHFSNNFKSLSPWQKITFYLVIFFGLLFAFVLCLVAVF